MNFEILNKLLDSKYTTKRWPGVDKFDVCYRRKKIGCVFYHKRHAEIILCNLWTDHNITYEDPDYQRKINDLFEKVMNQ